MSKNKIFNKKIALILSKIVVLAGVVMLTGLVKGSPAIVESSSDWDAKPVVVNVQVDLETKGDQLTVDNILVEIEEYNGHATVFVTGEFASNYPEIIKNIEKRQHQIAIHGWQKGEDLTLLNAKEQLGLIQRAFLAVRNVVNKPEEVVDFKPQGYKFNDDTIRILQELGAKSISSVFKSDDHQSFSACWYVQSLGRVTFPYPITNEFWAIPISTISTGAEDVPLDDEYIDNPQSFLNYLIEKYNQQTQTKDPLIFVVHPSITGTAETKLSVLTQFLDYIKNNNGKIAPLDSIRHFTSYITNLNATFSTTTASAGSEITINVSYTSNIWCPHYRFLMYGKYPGQAWQILEGVKEYCEFVYTGGHTFSRKFKVPDLPVGQATSTYTVRIVGRASYAACPPISDTTHWPNAEDFDVKKDVEIEVFDYKLKLLFVPLRWTNTQAVFNAEVDAQTNFFLNDIPLQNCRDKVKVEKLNVATQNFAGFTCTSTDCGVWRIKPFVKSLGIEPEDYDIIVGVAENSPCPPTAGCSNTSDTIWVISTYDIITAHEIGHIYGLEDEYCSNQAGSTDCRCNDGCNATGTCSKDINILDASLPFDCPPDGSNDSTGRPCCNFDAFHNCINVNYGVCCYGNKNSAGGRCTMSYANALGPRGYDNHCIAHLSTISELNCNSSDSSITLSSATSNADAFGKIIEVNLFIYQNDSVVKESINITEGRPISSSILQYQTGNYNLTTVDGEDNVLWDQSFSASFDYNGPVVLDEDYSNISYGSFYLSLRIPYDPGMRTLKLFHGENFIFSETLPVSIINGTVIDYNRNPVSNAFIQITGTGVDSTYTDEVGNYLLVGLKPGNYTINVTPNPYDNLMSSWASVSVSAGGIVTRNFVLNSAGSIAGTVSDANGNLIPGVHLYLSGYEMPRYQTNEEGKYIIPGLGAGTYTINIGAPGYGPWYILVNGSYLSHERFYFTTVKVNLSQTTWVDFTQQPPPMPDILVEPQSFEATLTQGEIVDKFLTIGNNGADVLEFNISEAKLYFYDNMESGENGWTYTGLWHITEHRNQSPTHAWYYGREGYWDFNIGRNYGSLTSPPIDLTNAENPILTFWRWEQTEGGSYWDYRHVYISTNSGATWNNIYVSQGLNQGEWIKESVDLSGYAGNMVLVKFEFDTRDALYNYFEGWYIDDVIISGGGVVDWLSEFPTSGTVEPANQTEITITIDTTNLELGEYTGYIVINSNDLDEGVIYIPVDLTIIANLPPIANANGPYVGYEGSQITFDASGSSDSDGDLLQYRWDFENDGTWNTEWSTNPTAPYTWGDDWTGTAKLEVSDGELTDIATTSVEVLNVAPTVDVGSDLEVFTGDTVNFSGSFTDPGWLDAHIAIWDFGDNASSAGILTEENEPPDATGQVTGSYIYYDKDTYIVNLTVTDDDGGVGTSTLEVIVKPIPATVDCDPDTLNLKSNGQWITCYIEMPASYDAKQIDGSVVSLNGISAYLGKEGWAKKEANDSNIMDQDGDGILERMVKFDRAQVQAILSPGEEVLLTLTGKVLYNAGLADFEGQDTIRVMK